MLGFITRVLLLFLCGCDGLLLAADVLSAAWLPALFHALLLPVLGCVLWREFAEAAEEAEQEERWRLLAEEAEDDLRW